jgi:predicted nuclease of predicted toxin-antitoxin system
VKFIVDECLSHLLVRDLATGGYPDAVHPIHIGLCGVRDDTIVDRAIAEDRVIITANARDFRRLLAAVTIHPGAIIVDARGRIPAWQRIQAALAFVELQQRPADYMVNRVVEVSATMGVRPYQLPPE